MTASKEAADGRTIKFEGTVQIVIMLAIGAAAGAASFTHVHNVAAAHGQGGWLAWADAVVLELMSLASGLELRHRKRHGKPRRTSGDQLVEIEHGTAVLPKERTQVPIIIPRRPDHLGF